MASRLHNKSRNLGLLSGILGLCEKPKIVNHYPWFLIGKPGFLIGYPRFLTEAVRNPGYNFKSIVSGSFNAPNAQ